MGGHYSFMTYAAVHWLEHLEACSSLIGEYTEKDIDYLSGILKEFLNENWRGGARAGSNAAKAKFRAFNRLSVFGQITKLASVKGSGLGRDESLKLGPFILRMRCILEKAALTDSGKGILSSFYGDRVFKCELPYCAHFYDGFSSARSRDLHSDKHQRLSKCPHASCPMAVVGFASEQQLNAHLASIHPPLIDGDAEFPSVATLQAISILERRTQENITEPIPLDPVRDDLRCVIIHVKLPLSKLTW